MLIDRQLDDPVAVRIADELRNALVEEIQERADDLIDELRKTGNLEVSVSGDAARVLSEKRIQQIAGEAIEKVIHDLETESAAGDKSDT